jgi:hypothetical protein
MIMDKFIEILLGLVFLLVPIYVWIVNFAGFGNAALVVLKGGIIWVSLLVGVMFLVMGLAGLKD